MNDRDEHLSQIATSWSMVRNATAPDHPDRKPAQEQLLGIYSDSIRRYLMACLRDQSPADEVYQNFALKLVRGDLGAADPDRGKFRHFVKRVLYHLIVDFHRRKQREGAKQELVADPSDHRVAGDPGDDAEFRKNWREGLLSHAWDQLKVDQQQRGGIYHSLLYAKVNGPNLSNDELLDRLEKETGTRPKSSSMRVTLHRARQRFADYLVEAVENSLPDRTPESLEEELIELDLMRYCEEALSRRRSL